MATPDRNMRRFALLGRLEAAYGTKEEVFDEWDAVLLTGEPKIKFVQDNVDRDLVLPWYGASQQIKGTSRAEIDFATELVGRGTEGEEPAWGKWLRGCGWSETVVNTGTAKRVVYTPANDNFEGMTIRFNRDGVRYTTTGARGTGKIEVPANKIPRATLNYMGFDVAPVEAAVPAINLSNFIDPQAANSANGARLLINPTLTDGRQLTGGTALPNTGITWDLGNKLSYAALMGGEHIRISDRKITAQLTAHMTTAQEVALWSAIDNLTVQRVGFTMGTVAGRRLTIYMDRVQRTNMQQQDVDGGLLISQDLICLPGPSGAAEMQIIAW